MCQLDWWEHKHAQLLLAKRSEMWLFHYCSEISSIPTGIFRKFIITCQVTKYVFRHKRTRTFVPRHDRNRTIISCQGTNFFGHKRVWVLMCLGTHVWVLTCLGTNVCGHNRVWAQSCGLKHLWALTCDLRPQYCSILWFLLYLSTTADSYKKVNSV